MTVVTWASQTSSSSLLLPLRARPPPSPRASGCPGRSRSKCIVISGLLQCRAPGAAAGAWAAPRPPSLSPQRLDRRLCGPGLTPGSAGGWPLAGPGPGTGRRCPVWARGGGRATSRSQPRLCVLTCDSEIPGPLESLTAGGCLAPSWQPSPYSTGSRHGHALPSSSVLPLSPTPTVCPSSQGWGSGFPDWTLDQALHLLGPSRTEAPTPRPAPARPDVVIT